MTPPQQKALAVVAEEPGCAIRRVAIRMRVSHATASYHLFALAKLGFLVRVRDGREVRHFAGSGAPEEGDYLDAFLRDPAKTAILRLLDQGVEGMTIHQMALAVGLPFGTVKRMLLQFHALGLVVMERRNFRYTVSMDPSSRAFVAARLATRIGRTA